jgi:von Willebrand factor type A domain
MNKRVVSIFALSLGVAAFLPAAQGCGSSGNGSGFDSTGTSGSSGSSGSSGASSSSGASGGSSGLFGDGGTSSSGGLDGGCATATASASRAPVYMLIALDGSGSMNRDPKNPSATVLKWAAVVPALDAIFDDVLSQKDPSFAMGMFVFSDQQDKSCILPPPIGCNGPYPESNDVPIGNVDQAHHDALRARIDGTQPNDGTPSQAAMTGAYQELNSYTAAAPVPPNGKKVFVFMTDGVPSDTNFKAANAAALAATALGQGILTFAVGIGDFPSADPGNYDPAFMGAIAQAGGTAPAGCNPSENVNVANVCHFQVTPGNKTAQQLTADFIAAINKIRGQVASCEYLLDKSKTGTVDPTQVNVVYTDGSGGVHNLVQDPANGWTYDNPSNPTKVILHGTDCDQVKADAKGQISIVLGCKTITK